jgi:hypothetical protein
VLMNIDEEHKHALIETLKSTGRALYFGILGLIVVALTALATSGSITDVNITYHGLTINLAYVILAAIGFIAKALDTYVHKNDSIDSNGIAPSFLQR